METSSATTLLQSDLQKSGLVFTDLDAYLAQEAELAAVGLKPHLYLSGPHSQTPGYVIPYYDITGMRAPFYRLRLFHPTPKGAKYLQPGNVGAWVYFPKGFAERLAAQIKKTGSNTVVIVTEGEKKAAKAMNDGFIACALGGVYNWRSTTIVLPEGTELVRNRNNEIVARIKGGNEQQSTADRRAVLANGMQQLIQVAQLHGLKIVIAFDADYPENPKVQRAAAELAFELRFNGIAATNIRQINLATVAGKKVGLDDFLVTEGAAALQKRIDDCLALRTAYPAHPNLKELIGKSLDAPLERSEVRNIALMIVTDMDRHGIRMIEKATNTPYYFDNRTKVLMPVNLLHHHEEPLHETRFGEFLYRQYDVAQADHKLIGWLAASFTGEHPIQQVNPSSVFTLNDHGLAYQIDDGHFVQVTPDPMIPAVIQTNGSGGILFKANQVEPIDGQELVRLIKEQVQWIESKPAFEEFPWCKAASEFKFLRPFDACIMGVLSYISPWLQRWRGTQLPVELMIGEPGSGKSSMYALRLMIQTGRAELRNQPTDIRDWYASITSQSGMHVTDNVAFATKELKQRISDEICRLVTEPKPTIEMRQLFTTSDNLRIPVHIAFAMTAIQQPFVNADIMQRAVIMELSAIGDNHESDWTSMALHRHGNRIGWLAHELAMLHVIFKRVRIPGVWQEGYKSKHRLTNFEQLFGIVAEILSMPDAANVQKSLSESSQNQVSEHDWTMEALKAFQIDRWPEQKANPKMSFACHDISAWAQDQEDFAENAVITNPRRLARYIKSHQYMVEKLAGVVEDEKRANRQTFKLVQV